MLNRSGVFIKCSDIKTINGLQKRTLSKIKNTFTCKTEPKKGIVLQNSQYKLKKILDEDYIQLPRFFARKIIKAKKPKEKWKTKQTKKVRKMDETDDIHSILSSLDDKYKEIMNNNKPEKNKDEKLKEHLYKLKTKLGLKDIEWKCKIETKEENKVNLTSTIKLKEYQQTIVNYLFENQFSKKNVKRGLAGLILKLDTGLGKSYVAMKLAEIINHRTLIITPNTNILFDWCSKIEKAFPGLKYGKQFGKEKTIGDITVGVVNSLLMKKITTSINGKEYTLSPVDYFSLFDFVIFDECVMFVSNKFSKIFKLTCAPYVIGLSATPEERNDGYHIVAQWWLGDILDVKTIPGYEQNVVNFTGRIHIVKYRGPEEFTKRVFTEANTINNHEVLEQLLSDNYRTAIILKYIKQLKDKGLNIFIFADRRHFLVKLKEKCDLLDITNNVNINTVTTAKEYKLLTKREKKIEEELRKTKDTEFLLGGTSRKRMLDVEKKSNIIMTTYAYYGVGKSLPKMNAIIFASPRKSNSRQFIGRVLRVGGDDSIRRQIVDIVDDKTHFKQQMYSRKKIYKEKEFEIETYTEEYLTIEEKLKEWKNKFVKEYFNYFSKELTKVILSYLYKEGDFFYVVNHLYNTFELNLEDKE